MTSGDSSPDTQWLGLEPSFLIATFTHVEMQSKISDLLCVANIVEDHKPVSNQPTANFIH